METELIQEMDKQLDGFEKWIKTQIEKELNGEYKQDVASANAFVNNLMLKMFELLSQMEQRSNQIKKGEDKKKAIQKLMIEYREEIKHYIPILKSQIKAKVRVASYIG